jgi:uncharacterized protein (TIGR00297 family)
MFIYKAILCIVLGIFIYKKKILDFQGSLTALVMGLLVVFFAGLSWLALMLVFLGITYLSTKYNYGEKSGLNVAEKNHGRRSVINVVANGLVPAFIAGVWYFNGNDCMNLVLVASYIASIASITGDTLSSELGVLSRGKPYLITSFERVPTGTDGGISPIGEFVGVTGALLIGISAWAIGLADVKIAVLVALIGGTVGFHVDSVLGAVFERRGMMGNASVNFLSTIAATLTGLYIALILA